jgi:uncharacterized NAD(P)/FAD-binding protein YdhS
MEEAGAVRPGRHKPVAIVGAGFSGTMVAANLARRGVGSILIEANGQAAQGAAYSTKEPAHLLNIRAQDMGAWADSPGDFSARQGIDPGSFAQRRQFGAYLRSILHDAVASGHVEVVDGRAVGARRENGLWRVAMESGDAIDCEVLVLATGNQPPAALSLLQGIGDRLIDNPWGERARAAIADSATRGLDVLVVGTSLTMIDVVLSLDSAGHFGKIVALSRRGKIPLRSESHEPAPISWEEIPAASVRRMVEWLRRRSAEVGWRSAIDSLRPHSQRLWQALPADQKRLFLRHGRPWWDIHRHRIAPQVAASVDALVAEGRLEIVAGRLLDARPTDDGVEVQYRRRGHDAPDPPHDYGYVFNCTGPLADIASTKDPLVRQLLDDEAVEPDDFAIGLAVDGRSRAGERLWALGTLTKGRYWETIAVPDIRVQAASVAKDISVELGR